MQKKRFLDGRIKRNPIQTSFLNTYVIALTFNLFLHLIYYIYRKTHWYKDYLNSNNATNVLFFLHNLWCTSVSLCFSLFSSIQSASKCFSLGLSNISLLFNKFLYSTVCCHFKTPYMALRVPTKSSSFSVSVHNLKRFNLRAFYCYFKGFNQFHPLHQCFKKQTF